MDTAAPPKVLVLARSADDARGLRDALSASAVVWTSVAEVPPEGVPEVILTDLSSREAAERLGWDATADGETRARAAVVTIAPAAWGDAALAADSTPRELTLACGLVGRIARLCHERDELTRTRAEITQLAETDPLSGLPNRRAWQRRLEALRTRVAGSGEPLWLAMVDLDDFKVVNDRLGMAGGDEVLARAAAALAAGLRRDDMVARLGGDEFGVLLFGVSGRHVRRVVDRLLAAVLQQAGVTASIGYVSDGTSESAEALLARANARCEPPSRPAAIARCWPSPDAPCGALPRLTPAARQETTPRRCGLYGPRSAATAIRRPRRSSPARS